MNRLGFFTAEESGKSDITIDGKIVCDYDYRIDYGVKENTNTRIIHNGRMLINVEPDSISKYLKPNEEKLLKKGLDSVISRMMNLI